MQRINSEALAHVNKSFGITGAGSPQTILEDGRVSQIIDVRNSARRRSNDFPLGRGLFDIRLEVTQAGAGEDDAFIDPYFIANPQNGMIQAVNTNIWDIWLLGASARADAADAADVTWASLSIDRSALMQAGSADQAGAAITPTDFRVPLIGWDDFAEFDATPGAWGVTAAGRMWVDMKMRMVPRTQLFFTAEVAAASTVECSIQFGLFPITLGQDGIY